MCALCTPETCTGSGRGSASVRSELGESERRTETGAACRDAGGRLHHASASVSFASLRIAISSATFHHPRSLWSHGIATVRSPPPLLPLVTTPPPPPPCLPYSADHTILHDHRARSLRRLHYLRPLRGGLHRFPDLSMPTRGVGNMPQAPSKMAKTLATHRQASPPRGRSTFIINHLR